MKGVILAGGTGSRLMPLTKATNKHLLPVCQKPMIYWPLETLKMFGIKEILVITGGNDIGDFMNVLNDGSEFEVAFTYKIQSKPNGIAGALALAKEFVGNENCTVILGDNIFKFTEKDIMAINKSINFFESYRAAHPLLVDEASYAGVCLKEVKDPERFGVASIANGEIKSIIEKPSSPISNLAVTGLYFYPPNVFDVISTISPSARGELEITEVNNFYIKNRMLDYILIDGFWHDAGTHESMMYCNEVLKNK